MFGLFKAKSVEVAAPVMGEIAALESVNDEVFSQKMVGDGIAIRPADGSFGSPLDGEITKIFPTGHAYRVRHKSGVEVMVHIGLDTVSLKGDGFEIVANEGESVKAGDTIIRADLDLIEKLGREIVTPVIVSEMGSFKRVEKKSGSVAKADIVMEVK